MSDIFVLLFDAIADALMTAGFSGVKTDKIQKAGCVFVSPQGIKRT